MHATSTVTLTNYYKKFRSISGALAVATGVGLPLSAWLVGVGSEYLFPPLGDSTVPARLGVMILAVVVTYIAFYVESIRSRTFVKFGLTAGIAFLALCSYLVFYMQFVRKIDAPAAGSAIHVSVGYERTKFAEQTFSSESDWEMLRARGTADEEISRLWTRRSIYVARLCLFSAYCGFILPLVLIFSLGVRYQL